MELIINIMLCTLLALFIMFIITKIVVEIMEYKLVKKVQQCTNEQMEQFIIFLRSMDKSQTTKEENIPSEKKSDNKTKKNKIDYSSMTVSQLQAIAKEKKIPKYYFMKKAELINVLNNEN